MASLVFGLTLVVTGVISGSSAFADQPSVRPNLLTNILICHATGNEADPYVKIEVDYNAVNGTDADGAGDHLLTHTGPVWYPGAKDAGVTWGDIIPPMDGVTVGLNWPEGEAIFNTGDCDVPVAATPTSVDVSDGGSDVSDEGGEFPETGSGSSEILMLGGVSVVLGSMLLALRRKSAIG